MKTPIASLTVLCLMLVAIPGSAQVLYDNGPINGTVDAWTINFGYLVSDSYRSDGSTVTGLQFGVWEFPGDTMLTVDWLISSEENAGTVLGHGRASVTDQFISSNKYGYNIDLITVNNLNVGQVAGATYWLTLQNAIETHPDLVFWDENSGIGCSSPGCPSMASENSLGTLSSEAFTITGGGTGTTPEPSSVMLFGSGMLGLAGMLRRRLS